MSCCISMYNFLLQDTFDAFFFMLKDSDCAPLYDVISRWFKEQPWANSRDPRNILRRSDVVWIWKAATFPQGKDDFNWVNEEFQWVRGSVLNLRIFILSKNIYVGRQVYMLMKAILYCKWNLSSTKIEIRIVKLLFGIYPTQLSHFEI